MYIGTKQVQKHQQHTNVEGGLTLCEHKLKNIAVHQLLPIYYKEPLFHRYQAMLRRLETAIIAIIHD